jgi:hypothetical protein
MKATGSSPGPHRFVDAFQRHLPQGGGDLANIAERLYVGDVRSREADARLFRMITRLYGEAEVRRVVAALARKRT